MLNQIKAIINGGLLVLKKPALLCRGDSPFWPFQRAWVEWRFESKNKDAFGFVAALTGATNEAVRSIPLEQKARIKLLYLLIRVVQPEVVVETGVSIGQSSQSILLAMEANGKGKLYSIELPNCQILADGETIGMLVDAPLRHRWHLILGDAREKLPGLLKQLEPIDIFFHDSLHTEKYMMWEYETAWPYLRKGGYLLSHDVSLAFLRFARSVGRDQEYYGPILSKFGGVVK